MKDKKLIFFDTETTGLEKIDRICEVALSYKYKYKYRYGNFNLPKKRYILEKLVKPPVSITPEAAMTTGITNEIVKDKELFKNTKEYKKIKTLLNEDNIYFIAYNAPFDQNMFYKEGLKIPKHKIIDLYRVMKHLYNGATKINRNGEKEPLANNKLQYFRYLLEFDKHEDFQLLVKDYGLNKIQAHTALSDIIVLEYLFYFIIKKFKLSFQDILNLSSSLVLEKNITFGNVFEKGKDFNSCFSETYIQYGKEKKGYEYLDWCSNNLNLSVDIEYSLKIYFFRNIINGNIEYKPKYLKYINFAICFEKNKEIIKKAINLLKEEGIISKDTSINEHENYLKNKFIEKLKKEKEEKKDLELGEKYPTILMLEILSKEIDKNINVKEGV